MPHKPGNRSLPANSPRNVRTINVVSLLVRWGVVRGNESKVRRWVVRRIRFDSTSSGRVLHVGPGRGIVLPWLGHVRLCQGVEERGIGRTLDCWWVEDPEHLSGRRIECIEVPILATLEDDLGGRAVDVDVCQHDAPRAIPVPEVMSRGLESPDDLARCFING